MAKHSTLQNLFIQLIHQNHEYQFADETFSRIPFTQYQLKAPSVFKQHLHRNPDAHSTYTTRTFYVCVYIKFCIRKQTHIYLYPSNLVFLIFSSQILLHFQFIQKFSVIPFIKYRYIFFSLFYFTYILADISSQSHHFSYYEWIKCAISSIKERTTT